MVKIHIEQLKRLHTMIVGKFLVFLYVRDFQFSYLVPLSYLSILTAH